MDFINKKRSKKYDRVMSRVYDRSLSSLGSSSNVTRHRISSSARDGAKPSSTNLNSGVFSELPLVLNDYEPEKPVQRTFVVKPRKIIKSLDPSKFPKTVLKSQQIVRSPPIMRVPGSAPSLLHRSPDKWSDVHLRDCYSSRSHSKLKDLKVRKHDLLNLLGT